MNATIRSAAECGVLYLHLQSLSYFDLGDLGGGGRVRTRNTLHEVGAALTPMSVRHGPRLASSDSESLENHNLTSHIFS